MNCTFVTDRLDFPYLVSYNVLELLESVRSALRVSSISGIFVSLEVPYRNFMSFSISVKVFRFVATNPLGVNKC